MLTVSQRKTRECEFFRVNKSLFRIPLEVRLEIYGYLLRSPRVICVRDSPHVRNDPPYDFVSVELVQLKAAEDGISSQAWMDNELSREKALSTESPKKEINSAILLISRETYLETQHIIYSENSFTFHVAESSVSVKLPLGVSQDHSLAEKHQNQFQASKYTVIPIERPKTNQVEICSVCDSPSCSEPSPFFETQPRDFRFIKTMIFGYRIVPGIIKSPVDTKRQQIFKDRCHYISQNLQLRHHTLVVESCHAYKYDREFGNPFSERFLASVPQMNWVQFLIPVVTNLKTLHISINRLELLEETVTEYLKSKMPKT